MLLYWWSSKSTYEPTVVQEGTEINLEDSEDKCFSYAYSVTEWLIHLQIDWLTNRLNEWLDYSTV
jgi:hypothetical protein